jgi:hypothetical protein
MQATLIELEKEKELARIERATTMMFPNSSDAPTMQSYIQVRLISPIFPSRNGIPDPGSKRFRIRIKHF